MKVPKGIFDVCLFGVGILGCGKGDMIVATGMEREHISVCSRLV